MTETPLWMPSKERQEASNLRRFLAALNAGRGLELGGYDDLHAFSIAEPGAFWTAVWDFAGVKATTRGERRCTTFGANRASDANVRSRGRSTACT